MITTEYIQKYFLPAGLCTPENTLPLQQLTQNIIDVATLHANELGVGYANLSRYGMAWVLSRLSIEMRSWPMVNQGYRIRTWVENYNRHFSQRVFEITSEDDGDVLGYARSVWMAINTELRESAPLTLLDNLRAAINPRPCPIDKMARLAPILSSDKDVTLAGYTFRYTDCDNNRHVNTTRYVELILNQWDLDFHDANRIARFDIAFHQETRFGDTVAVMVKPEAGLPTTFGVAITAADGSVATQARISYRPR